MKYDYPVIFARDRNGTVIAEVPDVPGAITVGKDEREAAERVQDAVVAILTTSVANRWPIPKPSRAKRGQPTVVLPAMVAAKLALYNAVIERRVTQRQLAQKLRIDPRQVRRLLDLDHYSRLEQVEAALSALGKQLVVERARRRLIAPGHPDGWSRQLNSNTQTGTNGVPGATSAGVEPLHHA